MTLYKDEKSIPLKNNAAKLLLLFLSRPHETLSKDTILDEVWQDSSVSEQVVFQNISHLRMLIADDAIKTYSKKGYQWQYDVAKNNANLMAKLKKSQIQILLYTLVILTSISLLWHFNVKQPSSQSNNLIIKPFKVIGSQNDDGLNSELSIGLQKLLLKNIDSVIEQQNTRLSSIYKKTVLTSDQYVLKGILNPQQDGYILRYELVGLNQRSWSGYIHFETTEILLLELENSLRRILNSEYFYLDTEQAITSELILLQEKYPNDLDILVRLVERKIAVNSFDMALAFIDKLKSITSSEFNTAYFGSSLLLRAKVYHLQGEFKQAQQLYYEADKILSLRQLFLLQSQVAINQAWLGLSFENYKQIKTFFTKAAHYAKQAHSPLKEVEAFTLWSILASKMGEDQDKYEYLAHASALLAQYQLDESHYAVIYYHYALFSTTQSTVNQYYKKILKLPETIKNKWIFEDVKQRLSDEYVAKKDWKNAFNLFSNGDKSAFTLNQLAFIYVEKKQLLEAKRHAMGAFTEARIEQNKLQSLNAALLLYFIENEQSRVKYKRFITDNSTDKWLSDNHQKLIKFEFYH